MFTPQPCHEHSEMYTEALTLFRAVLGAAQTEHRRLNDALLHSGLKLLQHSAAAATAQTSGARSRSLRYAQNAAANLYAAIDATWCSGQLSDEDRSLLRRRLYLVLTADQRDGSGTHRDPDEIIEGFESVQVAEPPITGAEHSPSPAWPTGGESPPLSTGGAPVAATAIARPETS